MNRSFLCLGGNLGDRLENIEKALVRIKKFAKIVKRSSIYETQSWGEISDNLYLNMCVEIHTKLDASGLMKALLQSEKELGRTRTSKLNTDRNIDIDILFFNESIIKSKLLHVPHPRLHLRKFVLIPLAEIAPKFVHPKLKKTISALKKQCKDKLNVTKFSPERFKVICIEGNIGSGKTTLAGDLSKELGALLIEERFEDNILLPSFYKDPKQFAFALELSFLLDRFEQLQKVMSLKHRHIICDYSIYKCLWFAKVNLKKYQYKAFKELFTLVSGALQKPDLFIYLETSVGNLKNNISKRGRIYEKGIQTNYLKKLDKEYKKGLAKLSVPQLHYSISSYDKDTSQRISKQVLEKIK
ncbi:MAG: 2-amino-4-hydroxy-6-hydroxymethyldihydropteridine diphosphokinase [Bacteroidota bacterium]|nr:2-amino-4-hydroxy-6-hydroxymethyldihydropteridine diphosphokinase [Bacteroidota bacterium]